MLHGSQSTGKYSTPKGSYVLKSISFLGLAVSAVCLDILIPHSYSIGINNWMAQPASLHPASTNATTQASSLPLTYYYLAKHWCSGARPRNAMNLVCWKSKIREKTGLGALGRRQAQPGDLGRLSAVSSRSERSGKRPTLEGGRINEKGGGGAV